jgi:RES domain-containing protein
VRTAWRIVKRQFVATAFTGEGALLYGGRWNSPGVPVVYVASSRALAILEMAVHLDRATLLSSFALIPCTFSERLMAAVDRRALPARWRQDPPPAELAVIGDRWIVQARSAVLAVPSAIVDDETNFLLNPAHPRFAEIRIGQPSDFAFDPRLIK